jgi:hypothetical protein
LAEAAVATGAVDMPVKLPAPVFGTAEHPGPKSAVVLADEPDDAAACVAGAEAAAAAPVEDAVELQAAAPTARAAAMPGTARRRRFFTVISLTVIALIMVVWCGALSRRHATNSPSSARRIGSTSIRCLAGRRVLANPRAA